MDCARTWQWMMQALDGTLSTEDERRMFLHHGGCRQCTESWKRLQEFDLLLPETATAPGTPDEDWIQSLMAQLPPVRRSFVRKPEFPPVTLQMTAMIWLGLLAAMGMTYLVSAGLSGVIRHVAEAAGWLVAAVENIIRLLTVVWGPAWQDTAGVASLLGAAGLLMLGALSVSGCFHAKGPFETRSGSRVFPSGQRGAGR